MSTASSAATRSPASTKTTNWGERAAAECLGHLLRGRVAISHQRLRVETSLPRLETSQVYWEPRAHPAYNMLRASAVSELNNLNVFGRRLLFDLSS